MSRRCCNCTFGVRRGVAFDYPVSEGPGPLVLRLSKYERGEGRKVVWIAPQALSAVTQGSLNVRW